MRWVTSNGKTIITISWMIQKLLGGNISIRLTVSFICIWLILMRNSLFEKSLFNWNLSKSSTSRPLGVFCNTRALPHARDCKVLRSSPSWKYYTIVSHALFQQNNLCLHSMRLLSKHTNINTNRNTKAHTGVNLSSLWYVKLQILTPLPKFIPNYQFEVLFLPIFGFMCM